MRGALRPNRQRWTMMVAPVALAVGILPCCSHSAAGQAAAGQAAANSASADPTATVPIGTAFTVASVAAVSVRVGAKVEAKLTHPVFVDNGLALPTGALLHGHIATLTPDRAMRWHARLRGDLTPYRSAAVSFDSIEENGKPVALQTTLPTTGVPVVSLTAGVPKQRHGLLRRVWAQAVDQIRMPIEFVLAPGRGQRMLDLIASQLPYHWQRLAAGTGWTFELAAPLPISEMPVADASSLDNARDSTSSLIHAGRKSDRQTDNPDKSEKATAANADGKADKAQVWHVRAILQSTVSSREAHRGDEVDALVVEPVYDEPVDKERGSTGTGAVRTVIIPQGALLVGRISDSRAARSLGRNGKLRFNFREIRVTGSKPRDVTGQMTSATADATQSLTMDAEGTVTPHNQSSIVVPLLLTALAGRAFDADGNLAAHTGVASNGFGLIGRVIGLASQSRNLAAGIGFYAAALSIYDNWLHHGREVVFPRDTRVEIEMAPLRSAALTPQSR